MLDADRLLADVQRSLPETKLLRDDPSGPSDGNTISGVRGDEHWRCRHGPALVGPDRLVIDIDPGAPYAAGGRDR